MYVATLHGNIMQYIALYGNVLRCITHMILVECENICDIDIAVPNIARW